jgi:hypothetical protein
VLPNKNGDFRAQLASGARDHEFDFVRKLLRPEAALPGRLSVLLLAPKDFCA